MKSKNAIKQFIKYETGIADSEPDVIDETVYGNVLDVPKCLDDFMNTYEPNNEVFNNYL